MTDTTSVDLSGEIIAATPRFIENKFDEITFRLIYYY
jgi:hypothetical protein